jgi:hypothetical protein
MRRFSWLAWLFLVLVAWSTPDSSIQWGTGAARVKLANDAAQPAAYTLTMPTSDGSTGDVLQTTNGTGTLTFGKVASSSIVDGTIVNDDVNANAAIDGSKISPLFVATIASLTGVSPTLSLSDTTSSVGISTIIGSLNFSSADPQSASPAGAIQVLGDASDGSSSYMRFNISSGGGVISPVYIDRFRLAISDGLVGTPGLSFQSDGNTGLYRNSADIMGLVAGGVETLQVRSSGIQLPLDFFVRGDTTLGDAAADQTTVSGSIANQRVSIACTTSATVIFTISGLATYLASCVRSGGSSTRGIAWVADDGGTINFSTLAANQVTFTSSGRTLLATCAASVTLTCGLLRLN